MWDLSEADYRNEQPDLSRPLQSYDDDSGLLDLDANVGGRKLRRKDKDIVSNEPLFNDEVYSIYWLTTHF